MKITSYSTNLKYTRSLRSLVYRPIRSLRSLLRLKFTQSCLIHSAETQRLSFIIVLGSASFPCGRFFSSLFYLLALKSLFIRCSPPCLQASGILFIKFIVPSVQPSSAYAHSYLSGSLQAGGAHSLLFYYHLTNLT